MDLFELLEDALVVLRRDADARVPDLEHHLVALRRQAGRHPDFALLGEFQGVGDEVAEDLDDLALVGMQRGKVQWIVEHQVGAGHGL